MSAPFVPSRKIQSEGDPKPLPAGSGATCWRARLSASASILAIFTLVTLLFFFEVSLLGRTFVPIHTAGLMGVHRPYGFPGEFRQDLYRLDPGASAWGSVPWIRKAGRELMAGRVPLWNEHQGFGWPLLANAQSGALDLLRLPVLLDGSILMWDAYYLCRSVLGLVAAYAFARRVELIRPAALFVAFSYVFSGHFLRFSNNLWIEIYFVLPLVLLGVEEIVRQRTRQGLVLTAVAIALVIYGGMPEVSLFVLLLGASYGLYRPLAECLLRGDVRAWQRHMLALAIAGALGVGLALPLLLPLFELVSESHSMAAGRSSNGLIYEALANGAMWIAPHLTGLPLEPQAAQHTHHYIGATVFMFAVVGALPSRSALYIRVGLFAVLFGALSLAKIFGVPGINEVGALPGLNVSHVPRWGGPVTGFCLSLLAGVGVQRVTRREAGLRAASLALVLASLLLVVGIQLNWGRLAARWPQVAEIPLLIAGLSATTAWVVTALRGHLSAGPVGGIACALVVAELFLLSPHGVYQDRYDPLTEPPYLEFLRERLSASQERVFGTGGLLYPNNASIFGLDDIRSLDALYPDRYLRYVRTLLSPAMVDRFVGGPIGSREGVPLTLGNPWFDLTGTRFVVSAVSEPAFDDASLIDRILAANIASLTRPGISKQAFTIDGETREVLFEHAPASLAYSTRLPDRDVALHFAPALPPNVWAPDKGDGVIFKISVQTSGEFVSVYRRQLYPQRNVADRRWIDERVDLSRFAGQEVTLVFETEAGTTASYDWAGWARLELRPPVGSESDVHTVYTAEARIVENPRAMPRAFLVSRVIGVADADEAANVIRQQLVDPRTTAVVEAAPSAAAEVRSNAGEVSVVRHEPTRVEIAVEPRQPSFLVLTDQYYPGWTASIDGRPVPIYPTDIAFRGVFVPPGRHHVEFRYEPASFRIGMAGAAIALACLAIVGVWPWVRPGRLAATRSRQRTTG